MKSDLESLLLSSYKEEMISFLRTHPEYFDETVKLALSDKQPFAWRAAFLLWGSMEENDTRIQKHLKAIVGCIKNKKDGHQRELLKILSKMEIKGKHEGILFDLCMNIWEQIDKDPSVRITALKFIFKVMKKYPELAQEIPIITQDHYLESLSPGVRNSVSRMVKEFNLSPKKKSTYTYEAE